MLVKTDVPRKFPGRVWGEGGVVGGGSCNMGKFWREHDGGGEGLWRERTLKGESYRESILR